MTIGHSNQSSSGGAAASAGPEFQAQVAAYYAVAMLCEGIAPTPFDLPGGSRIQAVRCEVEAAVDDIHLALSGDGTVAIQAKRRVTASTSKASPLASALTQFVHAWIDARDGADGRRPMRDESDRLVLACGPESVASVRRALPLLLQRLRDDPPVTPDELHRTNGDERRIWPIVLTHLRRAFEERCGHAPNARELTGLLSVMRVREFEFDGSARDADHAEALLAQTVLGSGVQAGAAWSHTVGLMLSAASGQRGLQRERLAQLLAAAGMAMQPAPSYRADVDRLREETLRSQRLLGPLGEIRLAGSTVKITRSLAPVALDRADQAPCLVVAEPGGGKSGVVADTIDLLAREGRDVVALLADRYAVADEAELSARLGLEHRLADVLSAWPGDRPGVLVIDGLDAARGGDALAPFTALIEDIAERDGRWTVLASVRTFDLRYSPRLQDAFRHTGGDVEFTTPEFAGVHHLRVPSLDDQELAQAGEAFLPLGALLEAAPDPLRELVRNPFNLARLADLLAAGAPEAELRPLQTQLELLDAYWTRRVRSPQAGVDARERLARALCQHAVDALALFAPRAQLATDGTTDEAIGQLLGSGVLVESQSPGGTDTLAFSHHVLFDYALARLMLRVDEATLAALLRDRPDLALVARPSLTLHFQWCWEHDRQLFWRVTFALAEDEAVPLLGRTAAPVVAAQSTSPDDLSPLTNALAVSGTEGARQTLVHVIGSALASGSRQRPLQHAPVSVWATFADQLSEHLDDHMATQVRILTWALLEERDRLDDEQRSAVGRVGRRLLLRALAADPSRSDLVYVGLNAVAATFDSDAGGARELLPRFVSYARLKEHGWEELHWLIEALFPIIDKVPELLSELYSNAFAVPMPDETTVMMGGPVMPLSSNRAQDFRVCLYTLADRYVQLLQVAPGLAIGALIDVCTSLAKRRVGRGPETGVSDVHWRNGFGRVIDDSSAWWDNGSGAVSHRDEDVMLGAYQNRLEELASNADVNGVEGLLDPLVNRDVPAVIWRRILDITNRYPGLLGPLLADALASTATVGDTNINLVAQPALAVCFEFLSAEQRAAIERAILSLPDDEEFARRRRNALLLALPEPLISSDGAREARAEVLAERGEPVEPPWLSDFLEDAPTPADCDHSEGGPGTLAALITPVEQLAQHSGSPPVDSAAAAAAIRALDDRLRAVEADNSLRNEGEGWLTLASVQLVAREPLPADDATAIATQILLRAAHAPQPSQSDHPDSVDDVPGWGFPAGRVDAARGLMALASHDSLPADGLDILQALARDANAAVRFQIAGRLHVLAAAHRDLAWQLAEQLAADPSAAVRERLLNSLARLTADDRDRALNLISRMFKEENARTTPHQGLRSSASRLLIESWVQLDAVQGRSQLNAIAADPGAYADTTRATFLVLRTLTTYGQPGDLEADAIRHRAIEAFTTVARASLTAFHSALAAAQAAQAEGHPIDQGSLKAAAGLVDHACSELYFASGAYEGPTDREQPGVSETQRERFYTEAEDLIDILCDAPLPPAAHRVMETLKCFIGRDPRGVLLRTGRVLQASHTWNYQHDQMALSLFVEITQRYLAEHRDLLADAACRAALLASLEFFVAAGWPEARRLVYRLDEAFR